ncbi:MAG: ParB/RepB/Spo0J family partition protein [Synergistaceae bacterium]|jgi:ParB family chromosome partitioning protein|nr:ParB/RepB/Spo0J family partition protein [Synergistaceae bacterium]
MAKQRGLGKGLSSLIPAAAIVAEEMPHLQLDVYDEKEEEASPLVVSCDSIFPNPFQPRRSINNEQLQNLTASIKEHGVLQPILVRRAEIGYQIIAGERRWRAAQMAGLKEIPVREFTTTDAQAMELALVENLQREDLSSVEIARGINELVTKLALTHEEVAEKIGLSRAAVTNKLRLLQLPERVLSMLENDEITEGHARALLSLPSEEKITEYAEMAIQKSLNVRQLEELVRNAPAAAKISAALPRKVNKSVDFEEEINMLHANYKLNIRVAGNRKNMGILIKGLKKWQIQLLLEYIEQHNEELFPKE